MPNVCAFAPTGSRLGPADVQGCMANLQAEAQRKARAGSGPAGLAVLEEGVGPKGGRGSPIGLHAVDLDERDDPRRGHELEDELLPEREADPAEDVPAWRPWVAAALHA